MLPSASSWQSVDSAAENPRLSSTLFEHPSADIVDRDFRGRFVENQKKLASSTNLPSLGRMRKTGSIVRFADEVPEELRKGKEKEILPPLQDENAGPSRMRPGSSGSVFSHGDDDADDNESSHDEMELPRVKSHLSLLIKHKRDETGSRDLGPEPTSSNSKGKGKEKAKSQDEELLSMAHRDGVTKAGGVQVPKSLRISEHIDPGDLSPSSPEPLF